MSRTAHLDGRQFRSLPRDRLRATPPVRPRGRARAPGSGRPSRPAARPGRTSASSVDVVGGDRLAVAARRASSGRERSSASYGLDERPEPLDRLDLEPRLLEELAAQPVERLLALLEEPAGQVPVARAAARPSRRREQHAAVALEERPARRAPSSPSTADAARRARRGGRARRARARGRSEGRAASRRGSPSARSLRDSASTASESRGQASFAQSPKSRSVRHASAMPGLRVDPEEACRCGRSGRTCAASCARRSSAGASRRAARSRGPSRSAPCGRSPGSTPSRPGNCTVRASASVSRREPRRRRAARARARAAARAAPRPRAAGEPASGKPQTAAK